MDKIDMHVHSTASDGTMFPEEVVRYAKQKGLKAIALTDHDTIDGIEEAIKAGEKYNIEIIPGIELAGDFNNTELHILGYYIDYENEEFKSIVENIKTNRDNRNIQMIKKLNELGFNITIDELYSMVVCKQVITRAHFAKLLLKKGYVKTCDEAFKKYISKGCPAFVARKLLTSRQCIELIIKYKGIPVLAHPTLYKMSMNDIELLIKQLKDYGLKGVESIYPLYTQNQEAEIKSITQKYNLKMTGGSDFHGKNKPNIELGEGIEKNISIPYELLKSLKFR